MFDSLNLTPLAKSCLKTAFRDLKKETNFQKALWIQNQIYGFSVALWTQDIINYKQHDAIRASSQRIIDRKFCK